MKNPKNILAVLFLLITFTSQAFAANLNTTSQWRSWQSDHAYAQRLSADANRAAARRSSAGYRQAAAIFDQIGNIHARNANRMSNLASYTNDPSIANQAAYQARSRNIHAQQWYGKAQSYRNLANQQARLGR